MAHPSLVGMALLLTVLGITLCNGWSEQKSASSQEDLDFDKRHLGSALNHRFGTWHYKDDKRKDDDVSGMDKRRLGSALNVRYGTWRYGRPLDHEDTKRLSPWWTAIRKRRSVNDVENVPFAGQSVGSQEDSDNRENTQDIVDDQDPVEIVDMEGNNRGIGSALNSDELLNRLHNANTNLETDGSNKDKRRLGSALNTRYGTWYYKPRTDDNIDKRHLGSALNSRYGTWAYARNKRALENSWNVDNKDILNSLLDKRFLGPALDVRYRHYGSPFYLSSGGKRWFPLLGKPSWASRDKRSAKEVEESSENILEHDDVNDANKEAAEQKHDKVHKKKRNHRKRHLGAALNQGFSSFHVTKYNPSRYLRDFENRHHKNPEARFVKLMG